jgi:hypothetical protein
MQTPIARQIILTLCLLALAAQLGQARSAPRDLLLANYDDGSEMNSEIIKDYLSSEECLRKCRGFSEEALQDSFEAFRAVWVDRMISFVINELNLDAESAKSIRKSPSSYMINYETFKLLAFR